MAQQPLTPRERYLRRKSALWLGRAPYDAHYAQISRNLLPMSGRFTVTDKNRGADRFNNIYDSTATKALRTLAAGLMAGMTSPARPWFRLTTTDPDLAEFEPVRDWLHQVTRLMRLVFNKSNTYRSLHTLYEELGAFGTAATIIEEDFDTIIHHYPLTVGEYAVAANRKGEVDTLARELSLSVGSMVTEFGKDKCSLTVRNMWDSNNFDAEIPVCHLIQPRAYQERDLKKYDGKNMRFASLYLEMGKDDVNTDLLREGGYKHFPALVPRWSASGGDTYGSGPGSDALGDIKQLQHDSLRKAEGIDYQTKPPLQIPTTYRNQEQDLLPGGVSYVDATGPGGGIRSAFDVNLRLDFLLDGIRDVREIIRSTFFADLFLMLANDQRSGITAREVAERHEEKLIMLGPVLERLHNELLAPKIDITFDRIMAAGILPPPPRDLVNSELKVEFVSMLAQAQRAVGLGSVDRLIGTVGVIAQVQAASGQMPTVHDKIDFDQAIDAYSEMLGVDPDLIVADDQVAIIRAERAQAQQAAQQAAAAPAMAQTAQTMSQTDTEGKNALTDVMRQFSGYSTGGA